MVGDREKAIESGCDDYDTKPVEFQRLLEKIETILAKGDAIMSDKTALGGVTEQMITEGEQKTKLFPLPMCAIRCGRH